MPWEWKGGRELPVWHNHPFKMPKKERDALVPLKLVTRKQWGALPNNDEYPMELPVNYVRYVHTLTDPCNTKEECVKIMRDMQTQHMREGMPDINWNFWIGGDGTVYEGRGWELDATRELDNWQHIEAECIDIAYIGKYDRFGK
ncbi:peptidoglycan recognition protein 1-like [Macrosteles quadrilineatus]|uniref:peptidoglycan recognition protein 1-like n=1 Tax=Macrosteles quadrilineatus TaxID=74068 RepID=UPI0023E0A2DA|nr:peptidoglycan recognition protein 1-like [Macrosteles quadrilineatus]